jgi:hypothetical protein
VRVLGTLIGAYVATVPALHRMIDVEPRRGGVIVVLRSREHEFRARKAHLRRSTIQYVERK